MKKLSRRGSNIRLSVVRNSAGRFRAGRASAEVAGRRRWWSLHGGRGSRHAGQRLLVKNSWGKSWRDPSAPAGCFWMAYSSNTDPSSAPRIAGAYSWCRKESNNENLHHPPRPLLRRLRHRSLPCGYEAMPPPAATCATACSQGPAWSHWATPTPMGATCQAVCENSSLTVPWNVVKLTSATSCQ